MAEIRNELSFFGSKDDMLKKSNAMLVSKGKFKSALAYDLFNIGLTRIEADFEKSGKKKYVARIYPTEINKLVKKGHNIYAELKTAAAQMTGAQIFIENEDNKEFECIAVVTKTKYENYIFEINYHEDIEDHIFALNSSYATESIAMLTMLKSLNTKRIYEVLNASAYKIRKTKTGEEIPAEVTYRFREFLYMIGICDINQSEILTYMAKRKKTEVIDYDYIYENIDPDPKYKVWQKFKTQVLEKAQKEMKEGSNLYFEFEGEREGRFVKKIHFYIYSNIPGENIVEEFEGVKGELQQKASEDYKQLEYPSILYPDLYNKYVGHNDLTDKDIDILLRDSTLNDEMHPEMVEQAIEAADQQMYLTNYVGWMRTFIKEGGYKTIPVANGKVISEEVIEIEKTYQEGPSLDMQKRIWNKMKANEKFPEFVEFIRNKGIPSVEMLEAAYSEAEASQMFADFKVGREVIF